MRTRYLPFTRLLLRVFLFFLVALTLSPTMIAAQGNLFFGQRHAYTVTFRGNGEAIVFARLIITNPGDEPLKDFTFEVPNATIGELGIVQQHQQQVCIRYQYIGSARVCDEYRSDYAASFYDSRGPLSAAEYKNAEFTESNGKYFVTLPYPIQPSQEGALIVAYAARGYVTKWFGLYRYAFETLKVDGRIAEVRVGVDVDTNLAIRGKRSNVDYVPLAEEPGLSDISSSFNLGAESSPVLDRVSSRIGNSGLLIEEAKNLAPEESFIVRGQYAARKIRLYVKDAVGAVLVILFFIIGYVFLKRYFRQKYPRNDAVTLPVNKATMVESFAQKTVTFLDPSVILAGFLSVAGILALVFFLQWFPDTRLYDFIEDPFYKYGELFSVVFVIASGLLVLLAFLLAFLGPASYMAVRRGWKGFLSTLIAEFVWSGIILILFLIIATAV